ncbi:MAG TPA: thioredoxin domain-containing protein [Verrucomicrobiae bacterium]|jgi:protein-disulfide isomerase|nr:thioredoxin domain-containing protein [Verrucomicrobiae bacterium]
MMMKARKGVPYLVSLIAALNVVTAQTTAAPAKAPARASSSVQAKTPVKDATTFPSKEDVEAAMKRTFGYDPSLTWEIYDIRPSVIPGVAEVLVSVNKQAPSHIYLSPDRQNAIVGNVIPFGADPFAPARVLLQAADGPARGAQTPVIYIVEFSDLECPHCKVAQATLEKLMADFPQVRFVFQQFPLPATLHPWAMKAAEYADCARADRDAFWKYVDSIFENQGGIALATADDKLKELATAAGLDASSIATCAAAPGTEARVKKSMALGAALEVNETPTVFINGRRVLSVANIPYDQLKSLVQFEIDHAGK